MWSEIKVGNFLAPPNMTDDLIYPWPRPGKATFCIEKNYILNIAGQKFMMSIFLYICYVTYVTGNIMKSKEIPPL